MISVHDRKSFSYILGVKRFYFTFGNSKNHPFVERCHTIIAVNDIQNDYPKDFKVISFES